MRLIQKSIFVALVALISACGSQYNHFTKDKNEASKYVYGEIDGPAKQLKNTYPAATPQSLEKAAKFRALVERELVSGYGSN
ncbi:MAG: hypothetical protein ACKVOU_00950 [Cytophagales bacterium]